VIIAIRVVAVLRWFCAVMVAATSAGRHAATVALRPPCTGLAVGRFGVGSAPATARAEAEWAVAVAAGEPVPAAAVPAQPLAVPAINRAGAVSSRTRAVEARMGWSPFVGVPVGVSMGKSAGDGATIGRRRRIAAHIRE
jgi:hypothetical protein